MHTENVVVNSVDTDLGGGSSGYGTGRKDKLKDGVVNSGEVAGTRGLVLLGAKTEGVYVDTGIRGTGGVLERLDGIEVGTLTLGEAVLSVKLKLSGDDRVLTPAVHVKGSLGKDESASIGDVSSGIILVKKTTRDVVSGSSVGANVVGKGINGISVVERLGTKSTE